MMFFFMGTVLIVSYLLGERTSDYSVPSRDFLTFVQTQAPTIIDLRESDEIDKLPIVYRPVIHFPFLDLQKDITQLQIDSALTYLLVCTDGNRSRLIASFLSARGILIPYLQDGLWGVPAKQLNLLHQKAK